MPNIEAQLIIGYRKNDTCREYYLIFMLDKTLCIHHALLSTDKKNSENYFIFKNTLFYIIKQLFPQRNNKKFHPYPILHQMTN